MKILKNKWEVLPIGKLEARSFAEEWHYAHGAGNVSTCEFGLFYKGDPGTLHGIAIWNPPPPGAAKSVSNNYHDVLALTRFCLRPDRPENAGSYLISQSIKRVNKKRYPMLLTYADTAQHHNGGLYRASNWMYDGMTGLNPVYVDNNNRQVSRKKGKNNYNKSQMLEMGYIYKGKHAKHRFIYPMFNRKNVVIVPKREQPDYRQMELIFNHEGKIIKHNAK